MLVEIILGKKTGDVALATALDFVRAIRKTPIVVNDSRGFFANRCVLNYIQEGHLMLMEGVPAAMIENVGAHGRHAGRPAVAQRRGGARPRLEDPEGDRGRSRPEGGRCRAEVAAAGTGREARPARPQERQGLLRLSAETGRSGCGRASPNCRPKKLDPDKIDIQELKHRLLVVQALEAARCVEEGVITDVREADVGSILGFGFAPFTGGTLSYIDMMGTKRFVDLCKQLEKKYGAALQAAEAAARHGAEGRHLLRPLRAGHRAGGVDFTLAEIEPARVG